ncbi:hypothetical protein BXZ70DRAFT_910031 [Cristinia sonorae]|uniref:DUF6534 domain-containing protein n=1 Tax=Cristinia sonorae TaxID=1940300 RepID=A0A8K0XLG9_9AGAR|nr:hypothetical protein BXZ70DRAFT_910031 [Cristinia sonorae]
MSSPPNFLPFYKFIGHLFNWGLYGVLTVQVYLYYISFPKDNYKLKTVVASAYILDTIQLTLATYDGFRIYGSGWGDAKQLDTMSLQWVSLPVLGGLVGALYQIFYAWRIYALGQNRWLACIILLISMVVIGSGIYEGAACARLLLMSEAPRRTYKPTIAWIGCAALGEAIITGSMFYYLHKARRSSRVKQTTNLLTRLIALTIETGLISATVDVTGLALFIALPDAAYYEPLAIVASKLFSIRVFILPVGEMLQKWTS